MIRTWNTPTEICTNQLLSIPIDGRWRWDEKKNQLIYESRHRIDQEKKFDSKEKLKMDLRTGFINYRKQNRPFERIIKTKDDSKITLIDVIQASLNVMSEMFYIPIEFEEYVRMPPVRKYLLYLLNYFYWFFQTMNNASPENGQHIDRSKSEKDRIRISYAHLLAALRELGCKYAMLLLGTDLKDYHHMRNGDLFYSCTEIDRTIHESLFIFSAYLIWITFYRQNFDLIRMELARLFRAGDDAEMLQMPIVESLEGRMRNEASIDSTNRHKLIDCTELFSKSLAKKAAMASDSKIPERKSSRQPTSSINWNVNDTSEKLSPTIQQRSSKSRLRSLLARDFHQEEANDEAYAFEGRSPIYRQKHRILLSQRQNHIRGILTRQLKSRNQSITEERYHRLKNDNQMNAQLNKEEMQSKIREREKTNRKRLAIQQLLNPASYKHSSILPAPNNPLDNSRMSVFTGDYQKFKNRSIQPNVEFKVQENLGIIGKPCTDFDLIRLTLKPYTKDDLLIPTEFLVTLPSKT